MRQVFLFPRRSPIPLPGGIIPAVINQDRQATMNQPTPSITRDPVYLITVGFFALLTTVLPALLGQHRFMPILQAFTLTVFVALPIHHRYPQGALRVLGLWLPLQFLTILLLTLVAGERVEQAIPGGFLLRGAVVDWFFGGGTYPAAFGAAPLARLGEVTGVVLGSLASAGLAGAWFMLRALNQAAYATGILLAALETPAWVLATIPWWTLLRVGGYAGLVALLAEPLLTYTWSPRHYWQKRRRLILWSLALVVGGLLAEAILPAWVARPPLP